MKIKAYQTAFHQTGAVRVREIHLSDDEVPEPGRLDLLLEQVFRNGQNMFQPVPDCYSLSVGDVVELPNGLKFRCLSAGWGALADDEDPTALTGRAAMGAAYESQRAKAVQA